MSMIMRAGMDIGKRMVMAIRMLVQRGCLLWWIHMYGRWLGMLLLHAHISHIGLVAITPMWLCMMWMGRQ
ncbi:hypothetical protein F5J12DRAFT_852990, partial [Pisolithus orientalis]|uniref:uncharacterized protein n=1 Tax=Pisolithus orientalis TaxID=936130 RepID=UPI0022242651